MVVDILAYRTNAGSMCTAAILSAYLRRQSTTLRVTYCWRAPSWGKTAAWLLLYGVFNWFTVVMSSSTCCISCEVLTSPSFPSRKEPHPFCLGPCKDTQRRALPQRYVSFKVNKLKNLRAFDSLALNCGRNGRCSYGETKSHPLLVSHCQTRGLGLGCDEVDI